MPSTENGVMPLGSTVNFWRALFLVLNQFAFPWMGTFGVSPSVFPLMSKNLLIPRASASSGRAVPVFMKYPSGQNGVASACFVQIAVADTVSDAWPTLPLIVTSPTRPLTPANSTQYVPGATATEFACPSAMRTGSSIFRLSFQIRTVFTAAGVTVSVTVLAPPGGGL